MSKAKTADKTQAIENRKITVVEKDAIDEIMFDTVRDAPKVDEICVNKNAEGLTQDAFTSFFSHAPKTQEDGDPVQKGVIDTFMALDEFRNLRACTQNDEIGSALGTVQFAPVLIKQVAEARKKLEEAQEKAKKEGKPGPKTLGEALSPAEQASLRQSMRRGLEQAQEKADEWNDQCAAWGLDKAELNQVPFDKRMGLAEQMGKSSRMKRISDLVGRFKNVVHASTATNPIHGYDEIVDVTIGDDLGRLLPSELIKLSETPDQFITDLLEKKLLNYSLKGKENLGKGPIIACVDNSGSMGGERIEWALAVALALLVLAEKQGRSFGLIVFNGHVVLRKYWPKQTKVSMEDKLQIAGIGADGGTNFYEPLSAAFEFRKKEPTLKPADIVFITDGECSFYGNQQAEIQTLKQETDVRIYGIGIDTSGESLQAFCDNVVTVSNLGEIETVRDLVMSTAQGQK